MGVAILNTFLISWLGRNPSKEGKLRLLRGSEVKKRGSHARIIGN